MLSPAQEFLRKMRPRLPWSPGFSYHPQSEIEDAGESSLHQPFPAAGLERTRHVDLTFEKEKSTAGSKSFNRMYCRFVMKPSEATARMSAWQW